MASVKTFDVTNLIHSSPRQIFCGYIAYIFAKFACKTNIQKSAFATPLVLVTPVALSALAGLCSIR